MLGPHNHRLGQLDDLMARRPADDALGPRQLAPALATRPGTVLDDLVGILRKAARGALMTRLAARLTPRPLTRRALRSLAAVAGRRQRRVLRVLSGPAFQRLNALAQIATSSNSNSA
jgi:hypothetical protein